MIKLIIYKIKKNFTNSIFLFLDLIVPKKDHYWIFPVYFIGRGNFTDNTLAVFERIKYDKTIKKVILTREQNIVVEGENIVIVPMNSIRALWYLLQSKIIFVQHSVWLDLKNAKFQIVLPIRRYIINLWHGIPIKDISHEHTGIINPRSLKEMKRYFVVTSSENDKRNMQKAFFVTPKNNFWITGVPRSDFLLMNESDLPKSYKSQLKTIRNLTNGKRLVLYAPTYRETNIGGEYYNFSEKELDVLEEYLIKNNMILALRYHTYRQPDFHQRLLERKNIIDFSEGVIADVRLIIRECELLITDYSSVYIDALYLEKKCISFAYDYEHYKRVQRGFFYEFEEVFPGTICQDFSGLMEAVSNSNEPLSTDEIKKYQRIKSLLFKYVDDKNSQRVVNKIRELVFG